MRLAIAVAALALAAPVALAASADGQFRMVGAGAVTCSQVMADLAATPAIQPEIVSWLQGYATATNRQVDDTWDLIGGGGVEAYFAAVQAECVASPDKTFETAAFDVLNANYATRAVVKP